MSSVTSFLNSSIGQKFVMALTGIALVLFLVVHMLGNLQIFAGPDTMNGYAAMLKGNMALLWTARLGLIAVFVLHLFNAIQLTVKNKKARPEHYRCEDTVQASSASRSMIVSGFILLLYIGYHVSHFTLGLTHPEHFSLVDSEGRHDVYSMVIHGFLNPWVAWGYVAAMAFMAYHLSHGIHSSLQTLGFWRATKSGNAQMAAGAISFVLFLGFIAVPVAVQLGLIGLSAG